MSQISNDDIYSICKTTQLITVTDKFLVLTSEWVWAPLKGFFQQSVEVFIVI